MGLSCINASWFYLKDLAGDIQGMSTGGDILVSPKSGTNTLIHEIAHELMHQGDNRPSDKTFFELEAESVAYVVGKHFGMDGLASPNYVALHGADSDMITGHLERIRDISAQIITSINTAPED